MADRTVKVALEAQVGNYIAHVKAAQKATVDMAHDVAKASKTHREGWDTISRAATIGGVALVAATGLAVKSYMDFEQEMSAVGAASQANAKQMELLRQVAIQAGKDTKFSASEAAQGEEELAKAGLSVADIAGGALSGALNLAAAGQISVAEAAETTATAMSQFHLKGSQATHVADLLSAAANKAQGGVSDMGNALKYVGPVANQMGVSIEETAGTIALLAHNGILGEQAGTSLRGMLASLTSPSKIAAEQMEQLGINVYDVSGKFVGFDGVAGQLRESLGNLSAADRDEALGRIFGNEQITTARILYSGGAKAVDEWTKKVDDSGNASRTAAQKMDNLAGDLEQLRGSIETALIQGGSAGNDTLRSLTQAATGTVNAFLALPKPLQQAAVGLTGISGAGLLAVGAAGIMIPKFREVRDALMAMGTTGPKVVGALGRVGSALTGPLGIALAAGTVALGYWAHKNAEAKQRVDDLTQAIIADGGALGDNSRDLVTNTLAREGVLKAVDDLGIDVSKFVDAALNPEGEAHREVTSALKDHTVAAFGFSEAGRAAAKGEKILSDNAALAMDALNGNNKEVKEATEQAKLKAKADKGAADAQGDLGGAFDDTTQAVKDQKAAVDDLKSALDALNGVHLDERQAARQYQQAIDDATAAVAKNGRTLDINTQAGRDNEAALDEVAQSANDLIGAQADAGVSSDKLAATMAKQRDKLVAVARGFGMSRDEAEKYADKVLSVPTDIFTTAHDNFGAAGRRADTLRGKLLRVQGRYEIRVDLVGTGPTEVNRLLSSTGRARGGLVGRYATGGRVRHFADGGGSVYGPGTATSDSIPAMLSNGEYVIRASSVEKYGVALMDAINHGVYENRGQAFRAAAGSPAAVLAGSQQDVRVTYVLQGADRSFAEQKADLFRETVFALRS